jgi:hypothetical protein
VPSDDGPSGGLVHDRGPMVWWDEALRVGRLGARRVTRRSSERRSGAGRDGLRRVRPARIVCELLDAVPEQDLDPVPLHSRHDASTEDRVLDQVVLGVAVRRPVGDGTLGRPAGDIPVEGVSALGAFRCGTGFAVFWRTAAGEVPRAFDRHDASSSPARPGLSSRLKPTRPTPTRFGATVLGKRKEGEGERRKGHHSARLDARVRRRGER